MVQKIKPKKHLMKKYTPKNNVESIFSVIKRKFSGTNKSKHTRLQNKETRLKTAIYNIDRVVKILNQDFNKVK